MILLLGSSTFPNFLDSLKYEISHKCMKGFTESVGYREQYLPHSTSKSYILTVVKSIVNVF